MDDAGLPTANRRHLDGLVFMDEGRHSAAELLLNPLGLGRRRSQTNGDVVRNVAAAYGQHSSVLNRSV